MQDEDSKAEIVRDEKKMYADATVRRRKRLAIPGFKRKR